MERPWWKFHGRDWLSDLELNRCSISARGLWIAMLALMNEGSPYGYLADKCGQVTPRDLALIQRISPSQCQRLLTELEENKVFSRDESGIIYSRRMVRDEEVRLKRAAGGYLGGNPNITLKDNGKDNHKGLPKGKPSSRARAYDSDSDSSSVVEATSNGNSSSEKWSDEKCAAFLRNLDWKVAKITEDQAEKVLALDITLLPATEDDGTTLAGVFYRLQQFECWWETYWRRVSKKEARIAFFKATVDAKVIDDIHRGQAAQMAEMMGREPDKRPHGATWLNQERWRDEVPVPSSEVADNAWTH